MSTREFQKIIRSISGKYSAAEIFRDFIKMGAISYHNAFAKDEVFEEEYLKTIKKYKADEQLKFADLLGHLVLEMDRNPRDVLGEIYMEMELGNEDGGQFFTPFHISQMISDVMFDKKVLNQRRITLTEPSCGSGGMIIAYARTLIKNGVNFQQKLYASAEDIDIKAVYMTYLQLSVLGIKAEVKHKNTLTEETWLTVYTPPLQYEMSFRKAEDLIAGKKESLMNGSNNGKR